MASPIVEILLGHQWMEAVPLVQILCIAAAVAFPSFLTQPLLISMGRVRDTFVLNLVLLPLSLSVAVLGSLHSIEMVALLRIPTSIIAVLVMMRVVGRVISVSLVDLLGATRRSMVITIAVASVPGLLQFWAGWEKLGAFIGLIVAGLGFGLVWLAAVHLTSHPITKEIRHIIGRLPRRRRKAA